MSEVSQNPELLKKQTETLEQNLNYSIDKQNGLLKKWFPDKVAAAQEKKLLEAVELRFDYQIETFRAFKDNQKKILVNFFEENLRRVIVEQGLITAKVQKAAIDSFIKNLKDAQIAVYDMIDEETEQITKIKNKMLKGRAESNLEKKINGYMYTMDNIFINFINKIGRTMSELDQSDN